MHGPWQYLLSASLAVCLVAGCSAGGAQIPTPSTSNGKTTMAETPDATEATGFALEVGQLCPSADAVGLALGWAVKANHFGTGWIEDATRCQYGTEDGRWIVMEARTGTSPTEAVDRWDRLDGAEVQVAAEPSLPQGTLVGGPTLPSGEAHEVCLVFLPTPDGNTILSWAQGDGDRPSNCKAVVNVIRHVLAAGVQSGEGSTASSGPGGLVYPGAGLDLGWAAPELCPDPTSLAAVFGPATLTQSDGKGYAPYCLYDNRAEKYSVTFEPYGAFDERNLSFDPDATVEEVPDLGTHGIYEFAALRVASPAVNQCALYVPLAQEQARTSLGEPVVVMVATLTADEPTDMESLCARVLELLRHVSWGEPSRTGTSWGLDRQFEVDCTRPASDQAKWLLIHSLSALLPSASERGEDWTYSPDFERVVRPALEAIKAECGAYLLMVAVDEVLAGSDVADPDARARIYEWATA